MTIEIRELIIEARVSEAAPVSAAESAARHGDEQAKLVELVVRRVMELLREQSRDQTRQTRGLS